MALEFDDVLEELWGSGWYQKRLVYFLLCGIFFFTPFAFLNQVFVLHIPGNVKKNLLLLIFFIK